MLFKCFVMICLTFEQRLLSVDIDILALEERIFYSDPIENKRDVLTCNISISIRDLVHLDWQ